jgi:hypothetical protein
MLKRRTLGVQNPLESQPSLGYYFLESNHSRAPNIPFVHKVDTKQLQIFATSHFSVILERSISNPRLPVQLAQVQFLQDQFFQDRFLEKSSG